jgi:hypothetical protein
MEARHVEVERFDAVVDRIRAVFPKLRVDVRKDHPHVHAIADLPVQPGLEFEISFNLQNRDELHLNAGRHFWVEWFPCGQQEVFHQFSDAVIGLISGEYRIVESYLFGRAVKAQLERPSESGGWEGITTWSNLGSLIPWARQRNVVQNKAL